MVILYMTFENCVHQTLRRNTNEKTTRLRLNSFWMRCTFPKTRRFTFSKVSSQLYCVVSVNNMTRIAYVCVCVRERVFWVK